ncbi:protein S100-Z-like [Mustelus asterias]
MGSPLSELETSMKSMMLVFHKYAGTDENQSKLTLSRNEAKQLLVKELSNFMKTPTDPKAMKDILDSMDIDGNQEMDFQEFIVMVSSITILCNDYLVHCLQKKGK